MKIEAEVRAGEMLKVNGFGSHGGNRKSSCAVQLDQIGIDTFQSHRWQRMAEVSVIEPETVLV